MRNSGIGYILCALGFVGIAGLHRFYLGKPMSGLLYFMTGGLFGIGTLFDLLRMQTLVDAANFHVLVGKQLTSPERDILRIAKKNNSVVTVQMVAMESNLSLADAKKELDTLRVQGYCTHDVDEDGVEIYCFQGLRAKSPLTQQTT